MYTKPIYKIIIAGDGGVGKSTLLKTKIHQKYSPVDKLTIGVDFDCIMIEEPSDEMAILAFDLGGQEHFHFIHKAFIYGAKAGIITYDLTNFRTLLNIPHWVELLQSEYPSIPLLIVGTKKDLVDKETLHHTQKEWNLIKKQLPSNANIIEHYQISNKNPKETADVFKNIRKLAVAWKDRMERVQQSGIASKQ